MYNETWICNHLNDELQQKEILKYKREIFRYLETSDITKFLKSKQFKLTSSIIEQKLKKCK